MISTKCKQFIMRLGDNDEIRKGFIELFEAFSNEPMNQELPAVTYILPCYDESCELQPGDWAPQIHLVLRKVEDESSTNDNDGDEADSEAEAEGSSG